MESKYQLEIEDAPGENQSQIKDQNEQYKDGMDAISISNAILRQENEEMQRTVDELRAALKQTRVKPQPGGSSLSAAAKEHHEDEKRRLQEINQKNMQRIAMLEDDLKRTYRQHIKSKEEFEKYKHDNSSKVNTLNATVVNEGQKLNSYVFRYDKLLYEKENLSVALSSFIPAAKEALETQKRFQQKLGKQLNSESKNYLPSISLNNEQESKCPSEILSRELSEQRQILADKLKEMEELEEFHELEKSTIMEEMKAIRNKAIADKNARSDHATASANHWGEKLEKEELRCSELTEKNEELMATSRELSLKNEHLGSELDQVKQEMASFKLKSHDASINEAEQRKIIDGLKRENHELISERDSMKVKMEALQRKLDNLEVDLNATRNELERSAKYPDPKKEKLMESLFEDGKLVNINDYTAEVQKLSSDQRVLKKKNRELENLVASLTSDKQEKLSTVSQLSAKNSEMEKKYLHLQVENETQTEQVSTLSEKVKELESYKENLSREIESALDENRKLLLATNSKDEALHEMEAKVEGLMTTISESAQSMSARKRRIEQLEEYLSSMRTYAIEYQRKADHLFKNATTEALMSKQKVIAYEKRMKRIQDNLEHFVQHKMSKGPSHSLHDVLVALRCTRGDC